MQLRIWSIKDGKCYRTLKVVCHSVTCNFEYLILVVFAGAPAGNHRHRHRRARAERCVVLAGWNRAIVGCWLGG